MALGKAFLFPMLLTMVRSTPWFDIFLFTRSQCMIFIKSWRSYIFTTVCMCVCVSVCLYVRKFLWTKFQPIGCTDLDAVFAKRLLIALAQTLSQLVTLCQRSRSWWPKMYVKWWKKFTKNSDLDIFEIRSHHFIAVILIPNMTILQNK